MIRNPILPGFNPDPSIIRVGVDYYIATSSFEWYPGIPIYHSKDLSNWNLIDYGLKTKKHIDLSSVAPSRGVWAPCLSYCGDEKRFYLVYSNVFSSNAVHLEIDNFLIWADAIHGPWSEPVYLNSSGIDPSLFHDEDGCKWIINQERDIRPNHEAYRSIIIQEYCSKDQKLIGHPTRLTYGATKRGYTEGAHIYKRNGWYYLTTAEGGTGYAHCVCILRSQNITGPYEAYNENPILTSSALNFNMDFSISYNMDHLINNETVIQKAGHGSLVETQTGEWFMVHLCGRPILPQKRCILGRETSIQKMEWTEDGWLRMADGTNIAKDQTESPCIPEHISTPIPTKCDFDDKKLDLHFNSLRNEITSDWADLTSRKGHLRLRGRESITSAHCPSLIARRLTAFHATVTTKMEFAADTYQHCAGLTCYYDMYTHYSIYQTYDEEKDSNVLIVGGIINGQHIDCGSEPICVKTNQHLYLQAQIDADKLQFFYSKDGVTFSKLAKALDMTNLSDEASDFGKFTGAFVGIFAQDVDRRTKYADFDYFQYEIRNSTIS